MKNINLVCAALGFTALLGSVPVSADQIFNEKVPVAFLLPITPCTSEAIGFEGDAHFLLNVTSNKNSFHLKGHINAQGIQGIGLDDADGYQLNGAANLNLNLNGSTGGNFDVVVNAGLIGQGAAGDARLHLLFHITQNASGDLTATFLKADAECR